MDMEFHYYITFITAVMGGFDSKSAYKIAHSAQFVDDNKSSISVKACDETYYNSTCTQTYNITLDKDELADLYRAFHFQPGGTNSEDFWVTRPNSPLSQHIMREAISTHNAYMIGIASHAFADTYAHQGFRGDNHPYNNPVGDATLPSYGHMYFGELPDMVGVKWLDMRTNAMTNNNARFIDAALGLLTIYAEYNRIKRHRLSRKQGELRQMLEGVFGSAVFYAPGVEVAKVGRIKCYNRFITERGFRALPEYLSYSWLQKCANYSILQQEYVAHHNFERSNWYKFQEQAKEYKNLALHTIKQYRRRYGL